jgi:molybdopterin molybdotransferase
MAQLSDDCFTGDGALLPLAEALDRIEKALVKIATDETRPLAACRGRILAEDVVAGIDVPGADNSAVDGYAVYFDDLAPVGETILPIAGRAAAGHALAGPQARGTSVRIFTGAVMPLGPAGPGPDTVLMQEDCRVSGDRVTIPAGIKRGANRRKAGEDIKKGQPILGAGQRPQDLALAAAIGRAELSIARPLRVGLFSTGDELVEPGANPRAGSIFDSNRILALTQLEHWGCTVLDLGILRDNREALAAALAAAAPDLDLIVTTGGVSGGEEDHVRAAIEAQGKLHFWRLAIKPGRPIALGQIVARNGRQVPILGLPGNPVAAFVTLAYVGRRIVFRLMGALHAPETLFPVCADFSHKKKPGRREWLRVRLTERGDDGLAKAALFPREGAGILSSLVFADGLAEIPEDVIRINPGMRVDFRPFALID